MDPSPIQEILDNLDVQLAAGKIDLETYQRLNAKWQAKLAEIKGSGQTEKMPALAPPAAVETIACPECSAPLEDLTAAPGSIVRCSYCRATFTLKQAQEQTERSNSELRQWLDKLMVDAGASGAVDTASRQFIFNEKLYPALELDYRRGMEPYEDVYEHPLVSLDILASMSGYSPSDHVLIRYPEALPRVRALSLKVNSPLLAGFAVADGDRFKLRELDAGTTNLIYLSNTAHHLLQTTPESYITAKENLTALSKVYGESLASAEDASTKKYLEAMRSRLEADIQILDVLAAIMAPESDFAARVFLEMLEKSQSLLAQAHQDADESNYNPLPLVPFKTGSDREGRILQLITAILRSYDVASRSRPLVFSTYYSDLKRMLATLGQGATDPLQLVSAIQSLDGIIEARRGEQNLRILDDWRWCSDRIAAGRKQSLFGGGETAREHCPYWHPFWFGSLKYTVAKGTFLVSGVQQTGFILLDGVGSGAPIFILENHVFYPSLVQAVSSTSSCDDKPILPPLVSHSAASQVMQSSARNVPTFRTVQVNVEGVIYLPASIVRYDSTSGSRLAHYSIVGTACPEAGRVLPDFNSFFERYC